jgi:hypothetical protein
VVRAALIAISLLVVGAPRFAVADCIIPPRTFSPPAGSTLPPNPSLFLFAHEKEKTPAVRATDASGTSVVAKVTKLPGPPAFGAWRIDIQAPIGTRFVVETDESKAQYSVEAVPHAVERRARVRGDHRRSRQIRRGAAHDVRDAALGSPVFAGRS